MTADEFAKLPLMTIPFRRLAPYLSGSILFCVFIGGVYHGGPYNHSTDDPNRKSLTKKHPSD